MLSFPRRPLRALAVAAALALPNLSTALAQPVQQQPRASDNQRLLAETLAAYIRAFNHHDAAAVARLWKADAVHVSKNSGVQTTGRQAIQDAYAALFKGDPKCQLQITVSQLRFVTPAVANLECIADVKHTSGETSRSEFSALILLEGSNWFVDKVQETDLPLVPASTVQLGRLGWLVGNWVDETKDGRVTNETHFADGGSFLVRSYHMEQDGAVVRAGTQVIGWDAEQKCLRSWLFDTSGSFGEGTWLPEGENKWVNKLVLKLADGRRGSLTQVYERAGDDKLTVTTIDREIDGQAQPNGAAVTLSRAAIERPAAIAPQQGKQP
jgi:uncharacterized protein (TIGR02246 family)